MDGSYTCSTNGTGFGQLVIDWTVNGMAVTPGATITYTNQTNGATVSAMSTLNVKQGVMTVSCTAYFDTNMTNSSTSNLVTTQRKSVPFQYDLYKACWRAVSLFKIHY